MANTQNIWEAGKPEEGDPIRYNLATPITVRGTNPSKDGLLINCFVEYDKYGEPWVQKRPGVVVTQSFTGAATCQGLALHSDLLYGAANRVLYRLTSSAAGYSTGGASWTQLSITNPWTVRYEFDCVVFNDRLWLASGRDTFVGYADVWSSIDGQNWTQVVSGAPWSKRSNARLLVFNNELYMIGGYDPAIGVLSATNDVWKSSDGLNWTLLTSAAQFQPRYGYGFIAFNNGMFIIGGIAVIAGVTTPMNDVWFSTDGITWVIITTAAAFAVRSNFGVVSFKGKIWLYGGLLGVGESDELYASSDGKVFVLQNAAATGTSRQMPGMCVYKDRIVILGGQHGAAFQSSVYFSDVSGVNYTLMTAAPGWVAGEFFNRTVVFQLPVAISPTRQTSIWGVGQRNGGGGAAGSNDTWYSNLDVLITSSFTIPTSVTEDLYFQEQNAGRYLLMKDSQGLYVFDQNIILQVTDSNYPGLTVDGLVVLDDTAYVMDQFGVIYGSNLSTPWVWNALNYLTAEYEADKGVRLAKYLNYVVALKKNTISFFFDAGDTPGSPLMPMRNNTSRVGCALPKTVVTVSNTLIWVGRTNTMELNIFMLNGFMPMPIGDPFILRILHDIVQADARAWSCTVKGHNFYVLTCYGLDLTYAYDLETKLWARWYNATGNAFPYNLYGTDNVNNYLLNDTTGSLAQLSGSFNNDNGVAFQVVVQTNPIDGGTDLYKFFSRVDLIGDRNNGTINVSWSDDDYVTYSTPRTIDTTSPPMNRATLTRLGRARRRSFFITQTEANFPFRQKAIEMYVLQGNA